MSLFFGNQSGWMKVPMSPLAKKLFNYNKELGYIITLLLAYRLEPKIILDKYQDMPIGAQFGKQRVFSVEKDCAVYIRPHGTKKFNLFPPSYTI